jgi:hypothetical protein
MKEKTMNDIIIEPCRRSPRKSASLWEVRDNRNKLVGTFDPNKDKTRDKFDKLRSVAQIKNIKNDLFDIRESIKGVFQNHEDWQVCDRAMKAMSQTKDAIVELDEIIEHIKQS